MKRPQASEYVEYYGTYVDQVPDKPLDEVLREAPDRLEGLLSGVRSDDQTFAYAPGKWSIRDVVGHVIDTERLFSYRALHIARGESTDLPGMDQDEWAVVSNAGDRPLEDLLVEFRGLRTANTALFSSFDEETLSRSGVASGNTFTVRALAFIVAGHELHHYGVLAKRYLSVLAEKGVTSG